MNDRVGDYLGLVESLARKFVGRNAAEYDDLVQEGLIHVWRSLKRGINPAAAQIENRMNDWTRLLGTQMVPPRGRGSSGEAVEYGQLLPLDEPVRAGMYGEGDGLPLLVRDTITNDPIPLPGHDPLA